MLLSPENTLEETLVDIAAELEVPESRYGSAETRYHSVAEWLRRPGSTLAKYDLDIYIQGSFRLGTAIKPNSEKEDYDVDLVCEVSIAKSDVSQSALKAMIGVEIATYAKAKRMEFPEEGRRCWTLNYADGAQFHLDTLPAIPDGSNQQMLLARSGLSTDWANMAVAITDDKHENYELIHEEWPHSNPKGYAEWFKSRMGEPFEKRRKVIALEARADVEEIPYYRVKTPLQQAIQILKRHRDMSHEGDPDDKPVSILITTLAARAYQGEEKISDALHSILIGMEQFIEKRNGVDWVTNPTDPQENFADKWQTYPQRREAFHRWLGKAKEDFAAAQQAHERIGVGEALAPGLGRQLIEAAVNRRSPLVLAMEKAPVDRILAKIGAPLWRLLDPAHRQAPLWTVVPGGKVAIESVTLQQSGFRDRVLASDAPPVPKHCSLTFKATTDVAGPYQVYWQIVNTGPQARSKGQLRGGFLEGYAPQRGHLTHNESTLYRGSHTVECFIVKAGRCVARSGQFIVNIA